MDKIKVRTLLERWAILLNTGEKTSREKASKNGDGLSGRIRRTVGKPVIFDFETHKDQQEIQNLLCQELPRWADVIRSQPEIMDGYPWTRSDFIDLYFGHFRLVVEKLQRIIDQSTTV